MTRRWQSTIAIVAGLSLFYAVIAGWAERSQVVAAAPLHWVASAQANPDVGVNLGQLQTADGSQPAGHLDHHSSGVLPPHQKRFKSGVWMTRDRPPTGARSSPPSDRSLWSVGFSVLGFQPGSVHSVAFLGDRDILNQICVARR
jgi:hypothetical protein